MNEIAVKLVVLDEFEKDKELDERPRCKDEWRYGSVNRS